MKRNWLIGGLAGVLALAGVAFVQTGDAEVEADPHSQPIAFPHNVHAGSEPGQANMNCQFCHFSAERSVDAGIPAVAVCWGCHQLIPGTPGTDSAEEISKIQGYVQSGDPIPWVRVFKIADHAHFPHMRHINAGLECQQCHGEVQEMVEITASRGLRRVFFGAHPVWGGDNMGWCVDCHRQPDPATGEPQASTDCAVCHY